MNFTFSLSKNDIIIGKSVMICIFTKLIKKNSGIL